MFKPAIATFDRYIKYLDAQGIPEFNSDLGAEVRERLQQLDYIINRVKELEYIATNVSRRFDAEFKAHLEDLDQRGVSYEEEPDFPFTLMTTEEVEAHNKATFEMTLLTEAFYYFAGRVRSILRHPSTPLPGLSGFECVGVRNTRNKLLEHPDGKDSQVWIRSFGCGGKQGPVIKALRYDHQKDVFPDSGLYKNAEEFCANLERMLGKALA